MEQLDLYLGLIASLLIIASQMTYVIQVALKKVRPNLFSWFGWGCLLGVSFIAQFIELGWDWNLSGLMLSALGCFVVPVMALTNGYYNLGKFDVVYLVLGLGCLSIYLITENALITTIFGMVADFILAIPTFIKTYRDPESEHPLPWILSIASWMITLILCIGEVMLNWLFPVYLLIFCVFMLWLSLKKNEFSHNEILSE